MFLRTSVLFIIIILIDTVYVKKSVIPVIITTWAFENATSRAWLILKENGTALDAVELGATVCEQQQCDGTVGFGGSPDELGETTLDAMIMDGSTMNVGAVGNLRRIKHAAAVARHVLDYTKHSILTGDQATQFAKHMGFTEESLTTPHSKQLWMQWHNENQCQPNFWVDVVPNPEKQCGPYRPKHFFEQDRRSIKHHKPATIASTSYNHDTIGIVAIDHKGDIAASTSTNGAKSKIPGRIGDSPIPGAGAYAENSVGGAAATGDGDIMLRFLPSFLAVEQMRQGLSPTEAALTAIRRISKYYPDFMGAVVALNKKGDYGAACHGMPTFPFVVQNVTSHSHKLEHVVC